MLADMEKALVKARAQKYEEKIQDTKKIMEQENQLGEQTQVLAKLDALMVEERTAKEAAITASAVAKQELAVSKTTVSDLEAGQAQVVEEWAKIEQTHQEEVASLSRASAELKAKLVTQQVKAADSLEDLGTANALSVLTAAKVRTPCTSSQIHLHT
jgi:hypothetical protein